MVQKIFSVAIAAAVALAAHSSASALPTLARHIKIYTFNGEHSKKQPLAIPTCNNTAAPGWGASLGTITFKSPTTWVVGAQEWSDVVIATGCSKDTFAGSTTSADLRSDCRNGGNDTIGHLFSWCAVSRFQRQLCPDGWRVPTTADFSVLAAALGNSSAVYYSSTWGATVGSTCVYDGTIVPSGNYTGYWSQSQSAANTGDWSQDVAHNFALNRAMETSTLLTTRWRWEGLMLRCVRAKK